MYDKFKSQKQMFVNIHRQKIISYALQKRNHNDFHVELLIARARKYIGYSDKTVNQDIWNSLLIACDKTLPNPL
jgi:plasmid rolling circle replication initiator protein Rep